MSSYKSDLAPGYAAEPTLPLELLKNLGTLRIQDNILALFSSTKIQKKTFSPDEPVLQKYRTLLDNPTFGSEELQHLAATISINERIYSPDCSLFDIQENCLKCLSHPALFIDPQLIRIYQRQKSFFDGVILESPSSIQKSFDCLKQINLLSESKIPVSVDLSHLTPSKHNFNGGSLSGDIIPFVQSIVPYSNTSIRICLDVDHPDILDFAQLIPLLNQGGAKPTIRLTKSFFDSLRYPNHWKTQFRGIDGSPLNFATLVESLLKIIHSGNSLDFYKSKETLPAFNGALLPEKSCLATWHLNLCELAVTQQSKAEIKDLISSQCLLWDNALSDRSQNPYMVVNLLGIMDWVKMQGLDPTTQRGQETLLRYINDIHTHLEEVSQKMAIQRGGRNGRRFDFILTCLHLAGISEGFSISSGLSQDYLFIKDNHLLSPQFVLKKTNSTAALKLIQQMQYFEQTIFCFE